MPAPTGYSMMPSASMPRAFLPSSRAGDEIAEAFPRRVDCQLLCQNTGVAVRVSQSRSILPRLPASLVNFKLA